MADIRATIFDCAHAALNARQKATQRNAIKKLFAALWSVLPISERRAFLERIAPAAPYDLITFEPKWPELKDAELEEAARHWGYVIETLEGKELDFARSFHKVIRFRTKPSDKQIAWAKRLYADYRKYADLDGNVTESA